MKAGMCQVVPLTRIFANEGLWPPSAACLQVSAAKVVRALYYTLRDGTELWGAASQGPLKKYSMTAVLSRRSITGDSCSRHVTFKSQLKCSKFVLFGFELLT